MRYELSDKEWSISYWTSDYLFAEIAAALSTLRLIPLCTRATLPFARTMPFVRRSLCPLPAGTMSFARGPFVGSGINMPPSLCKHGPVAPNVSESVCFRIFRRLEEDDNVAHKLEKALAAVWFCDVRGAACSRVGQAERGANRRNLQAAAYGQCRRARPSVLLQPAWRGKPGRHDLCAATRCHRQHHKQAR